MNDLVVLNVVLVSRFPIDTNRPRGGVETATVSLACALSDSGRCKVTVVTAERGLQSNTIENHGEIEVHRLSRSNWPLIIDAFNGPTTKRLVRYIEALSPDIIHFQETWGFGSKQYPIPSLFTVHGFDSLNLPTEKAFAWRLRSLFWRIAESVAMKKQNRIISIAPYVTKSIRPLTTAGIDEIWNALKTEYFEVQRQEIPNRILFLGWLNPRKNPLAVVESVAALVEKYPTLEVILGGESSDEGYLKLLHQRISSMHLENHVSMPGRLSQTDVLQELATAAVMILPSLQENAPMVIAEAMASGVPVIASDLCGIPDMIEDGISGFLIQPNDTSALTSKINTLFEDGNLRQSVGKAAGISARKKFHPTSVACRTLQVYRDILTSLDAKASD